MSILQLIGHNLQNFPKNVFPVINETFESIKKVHRITVNMVLQKNETFISFKFRKISTLRTISQQLQTTMNTRTLLQSF